MNRAIALAVLSIVALSFLMSAAPALVRISLALVPLVLAVGIVAAVLRLVWHYTNHY